MLGAAQFFYDEQGVANIQADGALNFWQEREVRADRFPVAIERSTDQFAFGVHHRTSAVTTGDVVV